MKKTYLILLFYIYTCYASQDIQLFNISVAYNRSGKFLRSYSFEVYDATKIVVRDENHVQKIIIEQKEKLEKDAINNIIFEYVKNQENQSKK